jgi:hypothetical protein
MQGGLVGQDDITSLGRHPLCPAWEFFVGYVTNLPQIKVSIVGNIFDT